MDHQDDLKSALRRSRKDEEGRDFVCGCGKKYLSYPALYTHIKTKHEGNQPEGTQKTGSIAPVARKPKPKHDQNLIKELQSYVKIQDLQIIQQLDQNAQGLVVFGNRIKRELVGKQIFDSFNDIMKLSSFSLDKTSSIQNVFVAYLLGVGQFVSDTLHQYYAHFARLFRNCFRDCSQEIYDFCFKESDTVQREINLEECNLAPIICDFFLRFYAPYESKDQQFLSAVEVICFDFCYWMYSKKLSIVEVTMKKQRVALKKNLIQPKSKKIHSEGVSKQKSSVEKSPPKASNEIFGEKDQKEKGKDSQIENKNKNIENEGVEDENDMKQQQQNKQVQKIQVNKQSPQNVPPQDLQQEQLNPQQMDQQSMNEQNVENRGSSSSSEELEEQNEKEQSKFGQNIVEQSEIDVDEAQQKQGEEQK